MISQCCCPSWLNTLIKCVCVCMSVFSSELILSSHLPESSASQLELQADTRKRTDTIRTPRRILFSSTAFIWCFYC